MFDEGLEIGPALEAWLAQARPSADLPIVNEWDVFTIPYTSGTTGKPKGVLVPHRSRILTLFAMAVEYGCYGPDDRFMASAPMCHGAGMVFSLAPIFFGGYAEIMDKFEPEAVLDSLASESISGFFGVPTHFHALMSLPPAALAAGHLFVFRLTRPLLKLADDVEAVSEDNLTPLAPVKGRAEVTRLASALNTMIFRLKDYTGRLEASNRELERKHQELDRSHRRLRTSLSIAQELAALANLKDVSAYLIRAFRGIIECRNMALVVFSDRGGDACGRPRGAASS